MSCIPHLSLEPGKVRWAENVLASEKSAPSKLPWIDVLLIPHPSSCIPFLNGTLADEKRMQRGHTVLLFPAWDTCDRHPCQLSFFVFLFSLGIKEQYVIIAGYLGGNIILA